MQGSTLKGCRRIVTLLIEFKYKECSQHAGINTVITKYQHNIMYIISQVLTVVTETSFGLGAS